MKTIFKYRLKQTLESQLILLPKGAEVLTVQMQHGIPYIWAQVDTDKELEERWFISYGTGSTMLSINHVYIGTVQMLNGNYIWHVFEVIK